MFLLISCVLLGCVTTQFCTLSGSLFTTCHVTIDAEYLCSFPCKQQSCSTTIAQCQPSLLSCSNNHGNSAIQQSSTRCRRHNLHFGRICHLRVQAEVKKTTMLA